MELNLKETKVLLIDDDENYGFALKTLLGSKGLDINCFTNPEEALEFLKTKSVDIILLDYYMPQMTGEEFLRKFREFNEETIVFLQTAFSEEKPELEMLKTLNIQGYIDKNKDPDEIFLEISSGIKMSELMKKIKQQELKLDAQEYRNQFLGNFLNRLMGEIKERTFSISGNLVILEDLKTNMVKDKQENYEKSVQNIKNASKQLISLIEKLEINDSNITIKALKNTINALYEIKLGVKSKKLNIKQNFDNEYEIIPCKANNIIYILVDIIEELINKNEEEINILIEKEENGLVMKICNSVENETVINKISKIAMFDNKIEITKEPSQILIKILN